MSGVEWFQETDLSETELQWNWRWRRRDLTQAPYLRCLIYLI